MSKNRREALRVASFGRANKTPQEVIATAELYLKWLDGHPEAHPHAGYEYYYQINSYNGDVSVYRFRPEENRGHILNKGFSQWYQAVSRKDDLSTGYRKVSFEDLPRSIQPTVSVANSRGAI